jgi:ferrous iron transport protein B
MALAGNPNCGKTTLFNELTGSRQHVGNWPGVTVDKKEGTYKKDKSISILDLPGTYSLSPYSAEEIIARDYIVKEKPDVVINIVDGTSLERNLYLSLQIIETQIPMVVAVNMMDEVIKRGDSIDCDKLSKLLGIPVIPIAARRGEGIQTLMQAASKVAKEHTRINTFNYFPANIKEAIAQITKILKQGSEEEKEWKAVKLLETDDIVMQQLTEKEQNQVQEIIIEVEKSLELDSEATIADARYQYIAKLTKETVKKKHQGHVETSSDKLDKIITNRFLALPIFAVVMYIMFAATFSEDFLFIKGLQSPGIWLAGLAEQGYGYVASFIEGLVEGASPWVSSLIMDGVVEGIGAIIGFIPLVLVLYLLISFLEDSGYMARVAFVMDRIFRKFGLSGRSFIPLLMGFGCGVPAVMATRTLDSEKDRRITTIVTAFMPCGAKLPIFAMFASTFFADSNQTLITYSIYMLAIVVAVVVSLILNKVVYKSKASNFIMELPQYRFPTLKSVAIHGYEKVKGFIIKAGTVIFISTILLWLLTNFNVNSFNGENASNNEDQSIMCEMDESFLAAVGNAIEPVFRPLGFRGWRPTVAIATGWIAKEMVVVTFAQLYNEDITVEYLSEFFETYSTEELEEFGFSDGAFNEEEAFDIYAEGILFEGGDENALKSMKDDIPSKPAAYAFMIFNLLCMPCFAAVGATKRELKTWRLTGMAVCIQMVTAYIVALIARGVTSLFF